MTLGINTLVDAIAPILIGRLAVDLCPRVDGALIVGVDVVYEDIESAANFAAECAWTLPRFNLGRQPQHDEAVLQLYLPMHDCAILIGHPEADFEAKSLNQPIYRGGDVIVKEMGSDSGHVMRGI